MQKREYTTGLELSDRRWAKLVPLRIDQSSACQCAERQAYRSRSDALENGKRLSFDCRNSSCFRRPSSRPSVAADARCIRVVEMRQTFQFYVHTAPQGGGNFESTHSSARFSNDDDNAEVYVHLASSASLVLDRYLPTRTKYAL